MSALIEKIEEETSSEARGSYNSKAATRRAENATIVEERSDEDDDTPDGYFSTNNGGLLPLSFLELYNYMARSLILTNWTQPFDNQDELRDKAKNKVKFCSDIV